MTIDRDEWWMKITDEYDISEDIKKELKDIVMKTWETARQSYIYVNVPKYTDRDLHHELEEMREYVIEQENNKGSWGK